jgi:hypothetical protein
VPAAIEAVAVLIAGRTIGEWVVSVRAVARRRPVLLARLVKLVTGVGLLLALLATPGAWTGPAQLVFAAGTIGFAVRTREHRGLAHVAAGMDLEIVRPRSASSAARAERVA